jgi:hypothetical protein
MCGIQPDEGGNRATHSPSKEGTSTVSCMILQGSATINLTLALPFGVNFVPQKTKTFTFCIFFAVSVSLLIMKVGRVCNLLPAFQWK